MTRLKFFPALFLLVMAIMPLSQAADDAGNDWVLMADTHIPGEYEKSLNGVTPNLHLEQARREILVLDAKPTGVIIAGDTVFLQGEAADYRTLAKQLDSFTEAGIAAYPLLGNHDSYENCVVNAEKYAMKDSPVKDKQVWVVETPHANWFLLDSHINTRTGAGMLGEEQRLWLAEELDKRPDKPALLAAHHNLDAGDGTLQDQAKLWEIIKPRKQVKAYFYGHSHVYTQSVRDDVHLINLPAMAWRFDDKQPIGWTEATIKPNGVELKLHTLDKNHSKNGDVRNFEWLRQE